MANPSLPGLSDPDFDLFPDLFDLILVRGNGDLEFLNRLPVTKSVGDFQQRQQCYVGIPEPFGSLDHWLQSLRYRHVNSLE